MLRQNLTNRMSVPGLRWVKRLSLGSIVALIFVSIVVLAAIFAPLIAQHDPLASGTPVQPPSAEHWFGTDRQGRDIFARVLYGARYSLVIGLGATGLALLVALVLGSIAATASKWTAEILMRCLDIIMSFPGIALAAVFVAVFGRSLPILIATIAFLYVPQLTRVIRANVMAQYGNDYVAAATVSGAGTFRIMVKHVIRNTMAPVLVFATVLVADAIVFEASLSFIGAGVPDPEPSWGNVIAAGRALVMSGYWWATLFPGLAIMLTVLCLNVLSEGMTDALAAPNASGPAKAATAQTPAALISQASEVGVALTLEQRLEQFKYVELQRKDRLVPDYSVKPLLEVKDLAIRFPKRHGEVNVVDRVSFSVRPGQTMALVGESGCGKSITSLAIMGLHGEGAVLDGEINYNGKNLLEISGKEHNALRGHELAMIYQDALSSLNPSMLIRSQMKQLIKRGGTRSAEELLELVGLDPVRTLKSYPHELSGGQRQRVLIAMALTRDPKIVVADEPTTALDVTVQKQVIALLNELREKLGFALVFVSHDLALVAEVAHEITVMYAGQVVEQGETTQILTDPRHEYTRGLLGSVLSIEAGTGRLHQVPGTVPSPKDFTDGDRFATRSTNLDRDPHVRPEFVQVKQGVNHWFAATHVEAAELDRIGAGR